MFQFYLLFLSMYLGSYKIVLVKQLYKHVKKVVFLALRHLNNLLAWFPHFFYAQKLSWSPKATLDMLSHVVECELFLIRDGHLLKSTFVSLNVDKPLHIITSLHYDFFVTCNSCV
jgi:hypothetical protein